MAASVVDSTVRISFALVHGILLAMAVPIIYVLFPEYSKTAPLVALLIILPIISYLWGFFLTGISQYLYCGTLTLSKVAAASAAGPVATACISLLVYMLPFLRSEVEKAVPLQAEQDMREALGYSFYLFWAGMYGQSIASGLIQVCPQPGAS